MTIKRNVHWWKGERKGVGLENLWYVRQGLIKERSGIYNSAVRTKVADGGSWSCGIGVLGIRNVDDGVEWFALADMVVDYS